MVETYNLKYDIEVLSTERGALTKEVEALNAKRDDLFEGVRDAEQMKRVEIPIMPQRTILMLKKSKEGLLITIGNMFIELSKQTWNLS